MTQAEVLDRYLGVTQGVGKVAERPDAIVGPCGGRTRGPVDRRLTAPTMETLSIIAFKQPITKAEIEAIRGVRAEKALARLLEYELIAEVGRKQAIGRPILYGTTDRFLQVFGLKSLEDLPSLPTDEEALAQLDIQQLSLIDRGRLPGD